MTDWLVLSYWRGRRLPMVLQTEEGECGLACLAMVAAFWGYQTDLTFLRKSFSTSFRGTNMKDLIGIANSLKLQARPLKFTMEQLAFLKLPCVLHWNLTHYVVLKRTSKAFIVIHDPAVGERRIPIAEASKHISGIALELSPGAGFERGEAIQVFTLRSLMGRVTGLNRGFAEMLLLGVALQICALVAPFYLQLLVDEALVTADRALVTALGVGFLMLVVLQSAIAALRSWVTTILATSLNFQWLGNTFSHLLALPQSYFDRRYTGDIVSRFGSVQTIQQALTTQFVEAIVDGLLVMVTIVVMFVYSVQLTLVALCAVVTYALLRASTHRRQREASAEYILHAARQQTYLLESVRGSQTIRLYNRKEQRRAQWMSALADQLNAQLRVSRLNTGYQGANLLLFGAERIVVIWLAALAVLDAQLSIGMLLAFLSYKEQFSQRMAALIDKYFEIRMLRVHGARVADIVLSIPETDGTQHGVADGPGLSPSIEMKGVSFRYSQFEPFVIKNLDLHIPGGQCVALTGPSGCGKTTLVKILLGLLTPTEGEVLIDGKRLSDLSLSAYRERVGTVMQDDLLFSGSIADNISFFDEKSDEVRLEQCARLAAIHEDIIKMPIGYHTLLGEIGLGLSGGQKQRLLLARALYKQPSILVLDEATSHLDTENERYVNAAVAQIHLTRVIVAHRAETIAAAERVVTLEAGRVGHDKLATSGSPSTDLEERDEYA